MEWFHQFVDIVIKDYLWYHAFTLAVVVIICCLIAVHRRGTDINLSIAK
jgi:hypothetical protein